MKRRDTQKRWYRLFPVCFFFAVCIVIVLLKLYWAVPTPKHRLQWWLSAIEWDGERTKETGKGIRIAVLDSGIDASHPDLAGRIEGEYKVSGLEKEAQSSKLHGTAVAGILAGSPSHEKGILGVAVKASILSIDVTDNENGKLETEHLIEGIRYAISQSVDIINISAGVKNHSEELYKAVKEAYEAGIVMVAASGNYMNGDLLYPAKYEEVLAAGAVSRGNAVISPTGIIEKKIIYLPGEDIVTTSADGGYAGISGTSASTPILSGVIALMMEKDRTLTNDKIITYFNQCKKTTIKVRDCIELKYK